MTVQSFTFNPFQTNCLICHDGGEAVLIDPSSSTLRERQVVMDYLKKHDLSISHLLLTHAHIDHIFDCAFFTQEFGEAFKMHRADAPLLRGAQEQARLFGVSIETPPEPGVFLDQGATIKFGEAEWQILHTPGHSPGSICFYDEKNGFVISGDVLFSGSIGRTDLWQGSLPQLMESIFQELVPLGDDVVVYPGHGPSTTVGRERKQNPFLTGGYAPL